MSEYWIVNNPPEVVDEEWRLNGLFGVNKPECWVPQKKFTQIFIWAYSMWKAYETEEDRRKAAEQSKLAKEIIDEIIAER